MAYTGAASIVLRTKGLSNAKTIHSWLYKVIRVPDITKRDTYTNSYKMTIKFVTKPLPRSVKLIVIDEASMVPMSLKPELLKRGIKIICCGDLNQLPPVEDHPAFLYDGNVFRLTQIMRQKENSGIVYIANQILNNKPLQLGTYDNVDIIESKDMTDDMLKDNEIILCGFNNTRDKYNSRMRTINGIDPKKKMPEHGEKLICRKNNWNLEVDGINLANGLNGYVSSFPSMHSIKDRGASFVIDFTPLMFDMSFKNLKCSYVYFNSSRYEKDAIKHQYTSPYSRRAPIKGNLLELGYAVTVHLSQGSQYTNGIYIAENMGNGIKKNLDYTAVTRFKNHCIIVLPSKKYF